MNELRIALCKALTGLSETVNELDIKVTCGDPHPCGGKWQDDYDNVRKTYTALQEAWGQFDPDGYTTWCVGEEDRLIEKSAEYWG